MPAKNKFKILNLVPERSEGLKKRIYPHRLSRRIFFRVLTFTFIVGLLVFCVFQLNGLTRDIYFIQNYEKEINHFSEENKNLEIEFLNAKSLENITTLVEELNFEQVDRVHHIQLSEDEIVVKSR